LLDNRPIVVTPFHEGEVDSWEDGSGLDGYAYYWEAVYAVENGTRWIPFPLVYDPFARTGFIQHRGYMCGYGVNFKLDVTVSSTDSGRLDGYGTAYIDRYPPGSGSAYSKNWMRYGFRFICDGNGVFLSLQSPNTNLIDVPSGISIASYVPEGPTLKTASASATHYTNSELGGYRNIVECGGDSYTYPYSKTTVMGTRDGTGVSPAPAARPYDPWPWYLPYAGATDGLADGAMSGITITATSTIRTVVRVKIHRPMFVNYPSYARAESFITL
jgi:hypothetical protein